MRELTDSELDAVSAGRIRQSNRAKQVAVIVAVNAKVSVRQTIVQGNTIIST